MRLLLALVLVVHQLLPFVPLAGAYVAIGLSDSGATTASFQASGQPWLLVRQGALLDGVGGEWELRTGGAAGTILAAGAMTLQPWNPVAVSYDPVARTVSATVTVEASSYDEAREKGLAGVVIDGAVRVTPVEVWEQVAEQIDPREHREIDDVVLSDTGFVVSDARRVRG